MPESQQHTLDRVRKPRVHITYDVETGGAMEMKELPMVVGVLADLSGDTAVEDAQGNKLKVKDRKFVNIDRDNFNKVMDAIKPSVEFSVADRLTNEPDARVPVKIDFRHLDDFEPEAVVNKVDPLRKLLDARRRLSDLKGKVDGNDKLEALLAGVIESDEKRKQVEDTIGQRKTEGSSNE